MNITELRSFLVVRVFGKRVVGSLLQGKTVGTIQYTVIFQCSSSFPELHPGRLLLHDLLLYLLLVCSRPEHACIIFNLKLSNQH